MSRGKKPPAQPKPSVIYLNVDLSVEHKKELAEWADKNQDILPMLERIIDSSIRVGLSYDAYNDCIQCSLTQFPKEGTDDPTLVLVGRSADLYKAIQAAMFKYFVILQENLEDGDLKNPRGRTDWA
jgi:hypothetical protein